ncbi:MAG: hypothetical protein ACREQC_14145, partial [Candidatus Binataceae bacterium]
MRECEPGAGGEGARRLGRGDGALVRWCAFTGMPNESRLGLHLSNDSGDFVLVYYEPRNNRDPPVLR